MMPKDSDDARPSVPILSTMYRLLFLSFACLAALAAGRVVAQEPPTPIGLTLTEAAPGAYRIDVRPAGPVGTYAVRALVSAIGSDQGVVVDLGESDGAALTIDLALPLDGMRAAGCYRVNFDVSTEPKAPPGAGTANAGIGTRACVDAGGRVTFPAFDSVTTPPPTAPSDVRMVRVAGINGEPDTWRIDWRDNSTDEIAFDPGIVLLDKPWAEGGSAIAGIEMPEVQADQTSAGSIGFFFSPDTVRRSPSVAPRLFLCSRSALTARPSGLGRRRYRRASARAIISFPEAGDGAETRGDARWIRSDDALRAQRNRTVAAGDR